MYQVGMVYLILLALMCCSVVCHSLYSYDTFNNNKIVLAPVLACPDILRLRCALVVRV